MVWRGVWRVGGEGDWGEVEAGWVKGDFPVARRVLHDKYFKQAKAEGFAARSAYKLMQINDRHGLLKAGQRVLDLGCAPGSWLQAAAQIVGPTGRVAGIDLSPVTADVPSNVRTIVADAFATDPSQLLGIAELGADEKFDVLLSDMAPSTSGAGPTDHFRSIALCRRVLELARDVLRPGGNLTMKVFEGEAYPELLRETQAVFKTAKGYKPDATRSVSREMFIVALGYRPKSAGGPERRSDVAPAAPKPSPGWGRGA